MVIGRMPKEKVTVVMPVYNREKYIETAINSVLKQTLKNWKMLIIDDCSTDRTPVIIEKFKSEKIKHVRLPKNQGTGRSLQTALTMIGTPYFVIVNGKPVKSGIQKHRSFQDKYDYIKYGPMIYVDLKKTDISCLN